MLPGLCEGSHRASGSFRFVGTLVPTYTSGRPNYKRLLQQANGNRVLQLGSFTSRKCKFAHVLQPDRHDRIPVAERSTRVPGGGIRIAGSCFRRSEVRRMKNPFEKKN